MTTWNLFLFFLIFLLPAVSIAKKDDAYVKLNFGRARGYAVEPNSFGAHRVHIFKGIPFAQPPVDHLRFKLPRPAKPWFGTLDATEYKPACPSNTSRTTSPQHNTNEDCLYMNILADATCILTKDCPTLVIFHGGQFFYDSATMQNIDFLVEHYVSRGIIIAIPAYRLGAFGFLDIGDNTIVPRNLGLHDVILGLKWIQNEISNFGGDPDKVTLFGNSGGANIVTLLSVAPGVEKIWDKIIVSGPQTTIQKGSNRNVSVDILKTVGCWSDRGSEATLFPYQQLECLKSRSTQDIIEAQRLADEEGVIFDGPVPDSLIFYGQSFAQLLDEFKPAKALLGSTTHELHVPEEEIPEKCQKYLNVFDYTSDEVFDACIDKYLVERDNDSLSDITADGARAEIFKIASVLSRKFSPAFIYSFELEGYNYHSDETRFGLGLHSLLNVSEWKENYMLAYFPKVIERFVKYGVPDEDWPPFENGSNYKVIDVTNSSGTLRGPYSVRHFYFPETIKTWLVDFKLIDDTVKYEVFKNKTKEALEKWLEIREAKWEKFKKQWNEAQAILKEKYETWKEKKENATIEIFQKYKEAKQRKLEEQRFKIKQFVNYLLSHSIGDVIEKVDELEEFLGPKDVEKFTALEDVKDKLKSMRKELFKESLSPEIKQKAELKKRVKDAIKETIKDYINEQESDGNNSADGASVDNITEFTFTDPRIESLTKEEWDAAKKIFEEQRAALEAQANATYQAEKEKWEKVGAEINKKINETIAEREALKKAAIEKWNATKQARDEKKAEIRQKMNETVTKIEDKKKEIRDGIKQKITDKINEKKAEFEEIRAAREAGFAELGKNINTTIERLKNSKTEIEKDRPAVDEPVEEAEEAVKTAIAELRNATLAKFEERLSERKQWKSVVKELRNETFTKIFEKLKTIAQEKYEEDKAKFEKFKQAVDEIKPKIKEKITEKIIAKELGLFQGSFVALPPELQQNGGIDADPDSPSLNAQIENQRLWSAFWLVLIIAFFMAFALFAKSCFDWIRPRPKLGYFYNEDPGFFNFNEKSKIFVANPTYS
ncbi:hypothetical protein FO519_006636 [Halicephalobus sp. NKZ332]|nr:hypothetical protein FO519_006636 [Halicephalobus sp. NKZ332]